MSAFQASTGSANRNAKGCTLRWEMSAFQASTGFVNRIAKGCTLRLKMSAFQASIGSMARKALKGRNPLGRGAALPVYLPVHQTVVHFSIAQISNHAPHHDPQPSPAH